MKTHAITMFIVATMWTLFLILLLAGAFAKDAGFYIRQGDMQVVVGLHTIHFGENAYVLMLDRSMGSDRPWAIFGTYQEAFAAMQELENHQP